MIIQLEGFYYQRDEDGSDTKIPEGTDAELLDVKLDDNYTSGVAVKMRIYSIEGDIVDWIDAGLMLR